MRRNSVPAIANTPAGDASFVYDALGRRVEKTVGGVTTKYLYDGLDVVREMDGAGVEKAFYIRTLNIDEPLARLGADGTIRFYHADGLGSVIALTDENGVVKTVYNYSPFGITEMLGEASDNPFKYTGREDDGTGLYYYRARYYSPVMGRFISEDPIGFTGGDVNFYAYVGNSPLNWVDPLGLVVKRCRRRANVAWGLLDHHWIKTDTKEAGMGMANGDVPENQLPMSPYPETAIVDHTGESTMPGATCEVIPNVDEDTINSLLEIGMPLGPWRPWNNCQSVIDDFLNKGRINPEPELPAL